MLSSDELGAYILVLANSMQDNDFYKTLEDALEDNKQLLEESLADRSLHATQDDFDVFKKLGRDERYQLSSWSRYQVGVWEVMSNPFRTLRPLRISDDRMVSIRKTFDVKTFHFNKAFLNPEILWEQQWQSIDGHVFNLRVLYNKFPFVPYHTLIVPDSELQSEQYLTQLYHTMIWDLISETGKDIPGFGAGYNSLGACASVNHLHFQGFIRDRDFPIELEHWRHNGGDAEYPMRCWSLNDKNKAWDTIQKLHDNNMPYSVLYRSGCCYVIPRQFQGSERVNYAVAGAGWIEECGVFIAAGTDEINALTEGIIFDDLKSLSA